MYNVSNPCSQLPNACCKSSVSTHVYMVVDFQAGILALSTSVCLGLELYGFKLQ